MANTWTRQHFNAIAKEIRDVFPTREPENPNSMAGRRINELNTIESAILTTLALNLAKRFNRDNPNFDPHKFLDACSPDTTLYSLSELWEGDG